MLWPASSVNHMLPSGPRLMSQGSACSVGIGKSFMVPNGLGFFTLIRPMLLRDLLGEPDVALGVGADAGREPAEADGVLGDHPVDGDAPQLVDVLLGEPQRAVTAEGDVPWLGVLRRQVVLVRGSCLPC